MRRLVLLLIALLSLAACGASQHSGPIISRGSRFVEHHRYGPPPGVPAVGDILYTSNGQWSGNPTGFAYQWQDCDSNGNNCVNAAGSPNNTVRYVIASGDAGFTIRSVVTATYPGGQTAMQSSAPTAVVGSGGGGIPSGVTLQAVDGGTCDSATGPCHDNYYCSNGLTYACNAGWDNMSFVPIMQDYSFYWNNNNCCQSTTAYSGLGLNTGNRITGGTDMTNLRNAGIWAIPWTDAATNYGSETVGGHIEEPSCFSGSCGGNGSITTQAAALDSLFRVSGRFIAPVFTWTSIYYNNLNGSVCGGTTTMTMHQVMTCTAGMPNGQHVNIAQDDIYWFAGQNQSGYSQRYCGMIYSIGGGCTAAQSAEASHYGDMVDTMRSWTNAGNGTPGTGPVAPVIESSDGLTGRGSRQITPPELNWAAWDTIVHGARMLSYFGTTSDISGCGTSSGSNDFGFCKSVISGQSISDFTQASSTNGLVHNTAPIINSPFALNYASDSNGGYAFPTPDTTIGGGNQLDIMTKYYSGNSFTNSSGTFGPGFYVFVTGRGQEGTTNISTTITLPSTDTTSGSVPYICACSPRITTGSVTVAGHQFTDTLANAYDVHIYGPFH